MRNNAAPYQSPQLDAVLHAKLQDCKDVRYAEDDIALRDIALVGMLLTDTDAVQNGHITADDIYREDAAMLRRSFNALSKANIAIHPEARFQVYNILPPIQSDFLLAALDEDTHYPKNDISILMFLPKYGTTPMDRFYNGNTGFRSYDTDELYGNQSWAQYTSASRLHHEHHIWAEATKNLGSKLALIFGGISDEVTTQHFEGHESFTTLIDSEENQRKHGIDGRHNMGVIMRKDAMQEIAGYADPKSELGTALHRAMG